MMPADKTITTEYRGMVVSIASVCETCGADYFDGSAPREDRAIEALVYGENMAWSRHCQEAHDPDSHQRTHRHHCTRCGAEFDCGKASRDCRYRQRRDDLCRMCRAVGARGR